MASIPMVRTGAGSVNEECEQARLTQPLSQQILQHRVVGRFGRLSTKPLGTIYLESLVETAENP